MEGVLLQTERFGADAAPRKPWQDLNPIKKTDPARSRQLRRVHGRRRKG